ncbi:MAG: metallophosphoesterase [Planctomycetota bacterium]|nr:metallophosphoesterase [Planctomycetota bacterium]
MRAPLRFASVSVWVGLVVFACPLSAGAKAPFTLVALPDTQYYSAYYPALFTSQTTWIRNNLAAQNIAFVTHEGDVTDDASPAQFANATAAMYQLDGQTPYGIAPGNHDVGSPAYQNYLVNFGPAHFAGRSWYGGSYGASSYQYFTGGGRTFLSLSIQYDAPGDVLTWAQGVLNAPANAGLPTVVTTHDYLNAAGRSAYGNTLWNTLISPNQQIFMVLAGHDVNERNQTSTNAAGKPVFEVLADYQGGPNGGNGYLRLMSFDEDASAIHVKTYSPYVNAYQTGSLSQFDLPMNFNARLGLVPEPATISLLALGGLALRRRRA